MKFLLENDVDVIDLNGVDENGTGVQATSGLTGLGLPPVTVRWLEGVADGATYRGKRVLPRDIDMPLYVLGEDREDLKQWMSRLALMLSEPCTLRMVDDDGSTWVTDVVRTGGGDYTYGVDTIGDTEWQTIVTLRAPSPYWVASAPVSGGAGMFGLMAFGDLPEGDVDDGSVEVVSGSDLSGLLPDLTALHLAYEKTIADMTVNNVGNAPAKPLWTVVGPATRFEAALNDGQSFVWTGELAAGETLTVNTDTGEVVDGNGENRYTELDAGPVLWLLPPGESTFTTSLSGTNINSQVRCTFKPRRFLVI